MQLITKLFSALTGNEVYEILCARCEVFNMEQNIHYTDPDGVDKQALHCFFWEDGKVAAYLRAYLDEGSGENAVKVGRVLTRSRGQGVGRALMEQSIEAIKEWQPHCRVITMDAQRHAEGFYAKLGFLTVSDVFMEEGVEHVKMQMTLDTIPPLQKAMHIRPNA